MDAHRRRQVVTAIAGLLLLCLLVAIFVQTSELGEARRNNTPVNPMESETPSPPKGELLASGIERSLVQELPLMGKVSGARWISNHRFCLLDEEKARMWEEYATAPPPMDILVDAEDNFLMARLNGERFDTRCHPESVRRLLRSLLPVTDKVRASPEKQPRVASVKLAKIAWDDPVLGSAILGKFYAGFRSDPTFGKSWLEETFTVMDVLYEGDTTLRRVILARLTDGLATYTAARNPPAPDPLTGIVHGSNRYGAYVVTRASVIFSEEILWPQKMYLMEAWDGPCPWLPVQLDPECGENRLDEFMFPHEFDGYPVNYFDTGQLKERFTARQTLQAAADKRKAARLAQEAAAQGNRPEH